MKFIDLYDYLDFSFPIDVRCLHPTKRLYKGVLSKAPMTLANIEVYLVSFDLTEGRFIIYYEEDEEE